MGVFTGLIPPTSHHAILTQLLLTERHQHGTESRARFFEAQPGTRGGGGGGDEPVVTPPSHRLVCCWPSLGVVFARGFGGNVNVCEPFGGRYRGAKTMGE